MCLDVKQGGLKMISAQDQQQVFCIKWITRVAIKNNSPNAYLANMFLEKLGGTRYIVKSSLPNPESIFDTFIDNWFWKKAATAWSLLHFNIKKLSSVDNILLQPIFLNCNIKYKNIPLVFPLWLKNNVLFVCDVIDNNCINKNVILQKIGNYAGFIFDHNALMNSLPKDWFANIRVISNEDVEISVERKWEISETENKIFQMKNSDLRNCILNYNTFTKPNEALWKRKLDVDISENYAIASKATKESRLRLLHFKILHNIYPTNIILHKMKIKSSILCDHCHVPDYIEHFFCDCSLVCNFWRHISNFIKAKTSIDICLNRKHILFGLVHSHFAHIKREVFDYINHIILIGKLSISKFKYGKTKNMYLIFETELDIRNTTFTYQ